MKIEFYGGPWDGDRKQVGTGQREYLIPKAVEYPVGLIADDDETSTMIPMVVHVYEKRAFKSSLGSTELRMVYKGERAR